MEETGIDPVRHLIVQGVFEEDFGKDHARGVRCRKVVRGHAGSVAAIQALAIQGRAIETVCLIMIAMPAILGLFDRNNSVRSAATSRIERVAGQRHDRQRQDDDEMQEIVLSGHHFTCDSVMYLFLSIIRPRNPAKGSPCPGSVAERHCLITLNQPAVSVKHTAPMTHELPHGRIKHVPAMAWTDLHCSFHAVQFSKPGAQTNDVPHLARVMPVVPGMVGRLAKQFFPVDPDIGRQLAT